MNVKHTKDIHEELKALAPTLARLPRPEVPEGYGEGLEARIMERVVSGAAATPERRWRQGWKPWAAAGAAAAALALALTFLPQTTPLAEPTSDELFALYVDNDEVLALQEVLLVDALEAGDFESVSLESENLLNLSTETLSEWIYEM